MPQFDVSSFSSQVFWLIMVFTILYFLVSKVIAPKAEFILTQRHSFVDDNISEAKALSDKARSMQEQKDKKMEEVNTHVEELNRQASELLERHFLEQKNNLSVSLKKKSEKALVEIEEYSENFKFQQPPYCINLAAFIIERITKKTADVNLLKEIYEKTE
ncbi:MAG: hypothetical protein J0L79_03845 [Rickettsiales bacterium]|nr:hypothetical protein [Rickettsiales bacterium]MCA0254919.1 hypothetical protein [Pseudomonadota bacterium]